MERRRLLNIKLSLVLLAVTILLNGLAYGEDSEQFEKVTAALSTPALLDEYLNKNFSWASEKDGGGCVGVNIGLSLKGCPPDFIFKNKKGNCGAFTTFAIHCLRKAGYIAYPLYIVYPWPSSFSSGVSPRDYHIMVVYEEEGKIYTIDRGKPRDREGIKGPYNSVEDLPYKILKIDKEY